jgi:hypothetical protein
MFLSGLFCQIIIPPILFMSGFEEMGMKVPFLILVFLSVCGAQEYFTQDLKPWEKLGITSKEYAAANERSISTDSIKIITSHGIGIFEYLSEPWKSDSISREEWFGYHRKGLTSKNITDKVTDTTKTKLKIELGGDFNPQGKSALGLVPGYCQIKSGRKALGRAQIIVGSVGVAGVVSCAIFKPGAMPIPFFLCIVPVIPWSFATQ